MGPRRGESVFYPWSWKEHLWLLGPWLLLGIPLLVRRNRGPGVAAILVPVFVLYVPWPLLALVDPEIGNLLGSVFGTLAIGLGVLCLFAPTLAKLGRWGAYGFALLCTFVAVGLAATCDLGGRIAPTGSGSQLLVFTFFSSGVLISAIALTGFFCRERCDAFRFVFRLLLLLVVYSILFLVVARMIVGGPSSVLADGPFVVVIGVVYGLVGFALLIPFLVLAAAHRPSRERFHAALHLPRA